MRGWVAVLIVGGCFRPSPPSGAPCSDEGTCPSGLTCIAGACTTGGVPVDSPVVMGDDAPADAPKGVDAATSIDAPPCQTFSHQFDTCALDFSGGPLVVTGSATFDTKTGKIDGGNHVFGKMIGANAGPVWVVPATSFSLPAGVTLRVVGPYPLALAVNGAINLSGTVDLVGGAGTRSTCSAGAGTSHVGGSGGGGGGGFHGSGGSGGQGDSNTGPSMGGIHGGPMSLPQGPLGGCAGGAGGNGGTSMEGKGGVGGAGGGSVYLVAANAITIDTSGAINAGGAGGLGGTMPDGGGGGGGSGGFILIESPTLTMRGTLAANGGGGGGGGSMAGNGNAGDNGLPSATATSGAAAVTPGGAGANGSVAAALDGATITDIPLAAGGGGGGGAGFISILSGAQMITGILSPPKQ